MNLNLEFDIAKVSWEYLNEGNVHIVLQLVDSNKVMRLKKLNFSEKDDELEINTLRLVQQDSYFIKQIMLPLIFHKCDEYIEIIQFDGNSLSLIQTRLLPLRPEKRKHKAIFSKYAILTLNYCMPFTSTQSVYCVELKCKQGWFYPHLKSNGKCTYCLKQFSKFKDKLTNNISSFCPLDLFSGDRARMSLALYHLLDSPQNNIKIFKDGKILLSENENVDKAKVIIKEMDIFQGKVDIFIYFLVTVLRSDTSQKIMLDTNQAVEEIANSYLNHKMCIESESQLHPRSVLSNILALQKLEPLDIKSVIKTDQEYGYVNDLISYIKKENLDLTNIDDEITFMEHLNDLQRYMIAKVAKDCSIMISFTSGLNVSGPHTNLAMIGEKNVVYKMSVTDLDPKPESKVKCQIATTNKYIEILRSMNVQSK